MVDTSVTSDPLLLALPRDERGLPRAGGVSIVKKLGAGGFGAVYLGRDTSLDIDVAVKILPFHLASAEEEHVRRFEREARTAARIDHTNLVRVYAVSEEAGIHYLVQEFVDGESAGERVKREGPFSEADALDVCVGAGEALIAAHAKHIIHRDIKPDNVMIRFEDGRIKVTDLGLAKKVSAEDITGVTGSGRMMGTPAYMPPEQAANAKDVDTCSDIYSLGATLYALLAGQPPFTSDNLLEILRHVINDPPPDIRRRRADVSDATVLAIDRALQKAPAARFTDMQQMIAALKAARWTLGRTPTRLARPEMAGTTADLDAIAPVQVGAVTPVAGARVSPARQAAGLDTQSADLAQSLPCPKCDTGNKEGSRFCKKCGVSLVVKCPKCRKEVPADTQFCHHCGTNIPVLRAALRELKAAQDALKTGAFEKAKAAASSAVTAAPEIAAVKRFADDIASQAQEAARTRAIAENLARHQVWDNALQNWSLYVTICPNDEEARKALKKVRRIAGYKARAKKRKTLYIGLAAGSVALLFLVLIITGRKPPTPSRGEPTVRPAPEEPQAGPALSGVEGMPAPPIEGRTLAQPSPPVAQAFVPASSDWRRAVIQTFDFEEEDAETLGNMRFVKGNRVTDGGCGGSRAAYHAAWSRGSSAVLATLRFEGEGLKLGGGHCIAFAYKVDGTKDFRLGMQTPAKKTFKHVPEGAVQGTWQVAQVPLAGWSEDKNPKKGDLIRYFLFYAGQPRQVTATLTIDNVVLLSRKLSNEELSEAMRELFPPGQMWRDAIIEVLDFETEDQAKRFYGGERTVSGGYGGSNGTLKAVGKGNQWCAVTTELYPPRHASLCELAESTHLAFAYRLKGTSRLFINAGVSVSGKTKNFSFSKKLVGDGRWHVLHAKITGWSGRGQPVAGGVLKRLSFHVGAGGQEGVTFLLDNVTLLRRKLTDEELAEAMRELSTPKEIGTGEPPAPPSPPVAQASVPAVPVLVTSMPAAPVFPPPSGVVWYVDIDAKGGRKTGKSWADAFLHPQDAVDAAGTGDEIWVAEGTYTRRKQDDTVLLNLKSGVSVCGGFSGRERKREDRDPKRHMTVLDGEKAVGHVVCAYNVSKVVFSGFTVRRGGSPEKKGPLNGGGGLLLYNCENIHVGACVFEKNSQSSGGGMRLRGSKAVEIVRCSFTENAAIYAGAVLCSKGSSPRIANCLFWNNTTKTGGGAIYCEVQSSPVVTNCTFSENSVNGSGSAFGVSGCREPCRVTNCVFWGNRTKRRGPDVRSEEQSLVLSYCFIRQKAGYTDGGGNIRDDPLFVDAENGDFRLMAASPCVDSGTSEGAPDTDIAGTKRPQGKEVDIGAYEYFLVRRTGVVWYVDIDAKGGRKTGKSWADAFLHPQDAVSAARYGDEIWVAEGTYTRRKKTDGVLLQLKAGVSLYGGFSGAEANRDARSPQRHVTILDGEEAVHRVVSASSASRMTLAGFTVRRGGKGTQQSSGGGMRLSHGEDTHIVGCVFENNSAKLGGGMALYGTGATVEIVGCRFANNTAGAAGALFCDTGSSPTITNCVFSYNTARSAGAIDCSHASYAVLTNCTFYGNTAESEAGALGIYQYKEPYRITNCIFWGNTAKKQAPDIKGNQRFLILSSCCISQKGGYTDAGGNIHDDPLFVDAENGDFHLKPGSPCVDAGTGEGSPATDIEGTKRPQGKTVDIGAYEQ